jgi:hypothetical protein
VASLNHQRVGGGTEKSGSPSRFVLPAEGTGPSRKDGSDAVKQVSGSPFGARVGSGLAEGAVSGTVRRGGQAVPEAVAFPSARLRP